MSHVVEIATEIKDLESLSVACEKLDLELIRGQQKYNWYGHSVGDYPLPEGTTEEELGHCEHAIRVKGRPQAYEVGLKKTKTGYTLLYDHYSGGKGLMDRISTNGKNADKLTQRYAVEVASRQARRQGYRVTEAVGTDGRIRLTARR